MALTSGTPCSSNQRLFSAYRTLSFWLIRQYPFRLRVAMCTVAGSALGRPERSPAARFTARERNHPRWLRGRARARRPYLARPVVAQARRPQAAKVGSDALGRPACPPQARRRRERSPAARFNPRERNHPPWLRGRARARRPYLAQPVVAQAPRPQAAKVGSDALGRPGRSPAARLTPKERNHPPWLRGRARARRPYLARPVVAQAPRPQAAKVGSDALGRPERSPAARPLTVRSAAPRAGQSAAGR